LRQRLDPTEFYPIGEAAQWLGVKVETVKQHLRAGRLVGRVLDGKPRRTVVLADSILAFQAANPINPTPKMPARNSGIPKGCGTLISVAAAAATLGASEYTVRTWLRKGRLKGVRQGVRNAWMVCSNSVERKRRDLHLI
jgi:hypothetical protein